MYFLAFKLVKGGKSVILEYFCGLQFTMPWLGLIVTAGHDLMTTPEIYFAIIPSCPLGLDHQSAQCAHPSIHSFIFHTLPFQCQGRMSKIV